MLTLTYAIEQQDLVQYYLFAASKSERIKKKRRRSLLIIIGCFLVVGLIFYDADRPFTAIASLAWVVITILFYPMYERRQYKKHYEKFVTEKLKEEPDTKSTIIISDSILEVKDATTELKMNASELKQIAETGQHFILELKGGGGIVIPKSQVNIEPVKQELAQIAQSLKVAYTEELDWKWK